MLKKKYETLGLNESAAVILGEVVRNGQSSGWCGKSPSVLSQMEVILSKFNLQCTQDSNGNGIWELR